MSSDPLIPPRHLHRAAIVSGALDNLRQIAVAVILSVVLHAGNRGLSEVTLAITVGGALVALVLGYLRWVTEWYEIDNGTLRHRSGIVSPDETAVPLARIQAIDTSQGPVQRLFDVNAVHVQTAGGGAKGEIQLRALTAADVHALRAAAGLAEAAPAAELPEWRLGGRGLLVTALTAPQFGVILPLLGGAAATLDNLFSQNAARGLIDRLPSSGGVIVRLVVLVVLAGWLISFVGALMTFAGFSVVRDGERLRIRRGVLQRRTASVPVSRVHAVDVVEGILRRPFGLAAVRVEVAGYREERAAAQTLFPAVRVGEIDDLLREYVPHLGGALGALERPPARARRRYVLPPLVVGTLVGSVVALLWHAAWPALPLLALLGASDGWSRYRTAGWRLAGESIVLRRRQWTPARSTLVARLGRLQEHGLAQSPLQRRADLADLHVAVGSGRTGKVDQLELSTALRLFERLRVTR